ncbi:nitrate ABC transporter permease [Agromyces rhizosphaerae]|uniref:Nitrate ABC transporter permease n=1 Tax=Agromyces rhizosphaerae TaxID=88374 RepID=A0A9W6CX89_9MICO|nr:ABC transporter permease subunit [Agromyces rhizosphaerae]GLI26994.1 nitrate ABC transporter permease [Agromyces rhizosphaerae]
MSATMSLKTVSKRSSRGRGRGLLRRIVMIVALPLILLSLWWIGSANSTNFLNPPLSTIIGTFWETWFTADTFADTRFMSDVIPSVGRILAGYGVALVLGILLGVLIGSRRNLRAFLEPVLEFFRAIPPPVLVPIFMLFMGIGPEMRITVIAIGCIWPILLNTVEGVRGLDPVLKDTASAYRLRGRRRLTHLVLPGASPQIVTGARQALSIGIILMVISEMFAGRDGLGFSIVQFQRSFAIPEMWGGVILLGLLGVIMSLVFRVITDVILKWYYGYLQSQRGGE